MKKLLLSSIIMFGICGFVTAQNATGSKLQKASTPTTTSVAPTPQKSVGVAPAAAATTNPDARPASDKVNAPTAVAPTGKAARVAKTDATAISADGTVITTDEMIQKKKDAAAKAATPVQKN